MMMMMMVSGGVIGGVMREEIIGGVQGTRFTNSSPLTQTTCQIALTQQQET